MMIKILNRDYKCFSLSSVLLPGQVAVRDACPLAEFHLAHLLFHVAVVALADAAVFINDVEDGLHGFVVGNANGVVALHDAVQLIGCIYGFLFHNLIVANDVEHDLGCYN